MSRRARGYCIFLIFIGLFTFFSPSISTDTPVLGRSNWSPFEIVKEIHAGALPVRNEFRPALSQWRTNSFLLGISIHYLLLVVSLVLVVAPSWPELAIPGVIWGALSQMNPLYGRDRLGEDLQTLFYSSVDRWHLEKRWDIPIVHATQYQLLLLIVNALLLGVLFSDIVNRKRLLPYASSTGLRDVEDLEATLAAMPHEGSAKHSWEE